VGARIQSHCAWSIKPGAALTIITFEEATMAYGRIPLHSLTQSSLNTLTQAFPSAKRVLAYPKTGELRHFFTLEFHPPQKRLIDAAARDSGISSARFIYNAISGVAENVVGERRATQILGSPKVNVARRKGR
jgi:hypothetical protein